MNFSESASQNNPATAIEKVRVLIVGSGPAGYTAAIYCSRANLSPVLYEGLQPGGQLTITTDIENFPGYPDGVSGPVMMEQLKAQAAHFGTSIRPGIVTATNLSKHPFTVTIDGNKTIDTDVLIIATGATAKYLGLPDEMKYAGSGVSACATCDGFFYRNRDVGVVGGGDTAAEEAIYLSGLCRKIYLIVRRNELRASKVMQQRVLNTANIEVLWQHQVKSLYGEGVVEGAVLWKNKGTADEEEVSIGIDGLFLAIGHKPNSEVFAHTVETDDNGYIKTIPGSSRTNVPGVFACGDVQDPVYRQAVTSAGSGCMAAIDAERWLTENGK